MLLVIHWVKAVSVVNNAIDRSCLPYLQYGVDCRLDMYSLYNVLTYDLSMPNYSRALSLINFK